jgi:methyl-accepting chemotaxis protein
MPNPVFATLEELQQAGWELRSLGELTLKVAKDLSPADREQIVQLARRLETFCAQLKEIVADTWKVKDGSVSVAELHLHLEEAMQEHLTAILETLRRIASRTNKRTEGMADSVN